MKTIIITTTIILMMTLSLSAQLFGMKESQVPLSVKETFNRIYPDTEVSKWKHKQNNYIAKFSINRKKYEAVFNSEGDWVQTEIRIKWEELPSAVRKSYWETDYRWLSQNSAKIIEALNKEKLYLIEGDNSDEESEPPCRFKLWISEDGKIVKKESDCC
jgi:hypothetical protein